MAERKNVYIHMHILFCFLMEDSSLKIYTDVCVLIPFKVFYYIFATFSFEDYGHKKDDGQFFLLTYFILGKVHHFSVLKEVYTHLDLRILVHGFKE